MRASGTFKVADFTPAPVPAPGIETAVPVGVATMEKSYEGEVAGRSATLFTAAYDQETEVGTYVAMESFEGSLQGRAARSTSRTRRRPWASSEGASSS